MPSPTTPPPEPQGQSHKQKTDCTCALLQRRKASRDRRVLCCTRARACATTRAIGTWSRQHAFRIFRIFRSSTPSTYPAYSTSAGARALARSAPCSNTGVPHTSYADDMKPCCRFADNRALGEQRARAPSSYEQRAAVARDRRALAVRSTQPQPRREAAVAHAEGLKRKKFRK